ncbi:hypothetical protein DXO331_20690 [Xanthomonas oryzae pv. oryzae]|nr:hypothetical protein DXO331_20690 [Xanthomonas oryzae pv. oryzae]
MLVRAVGFACVLPACGPTALIRSAPRPDAPRRAPTRKVTAGAPSASALSLLTGITGDGS